YPAQERLVGLWYQAPGISEGDAPQSPALHFTLEADSRSFEALAMLSTRRGTVTGIGEPEEVPVANVTHAALPLFGAQPVRGRLFTAADDEPGAAPTAIVSWGYWQRRLDGDPAVVGRTLMLDGQAREIVGVVPADFRLPDDEADIFVPLQFDRA